MTDPATSVPRTGGKLFPVLEIFGPTIQGEGVDQGVPTYFVRFGGCDYRCVWCDSPQAVVPELVRKNAMKLTSGDILQALWALPKGPKWVVLTGGNPCLHDLSDLVDRLHTHGYLVAVETQGTLTPPWVWTADRICVSPKPPSSGLSCKRSLAALRAFLNTGGSIESLFLKVVVFTPEDLDWAARVFEEHPGYRSCLSLGTVPELSLLDYLDPEADVEKLEATPGMLFGDPDTPETLAWRYRELIGQVITRPEFAGTQVQLQNHVLAFGHAVGV